MTAQADLNARVWAKTDIVAGYATRTLRPVETTVLVRHRDALAGRTLELGCGAGRLTGYLAQISGDLIATDVSPAMLARARELYPAVAFEQLDLRDLSAVADGAHDAVVASYNLIDVLAHEERLALLRELRRILAPGGLLIASSHNLATADDRAMPWHLRRSDPLRLAADLVRLPRRLRGFLRGRRLERRADDHASLVDDAHDFSVLHYYVTPQAGSRQLEDAGLEVLERLDLDGRTLDPGETAPWSSEIHYVARRAWTPPPPGARVGR